MNPYLFAVTSLTLPDASAGSSIRCYQCSSVSSSCSTSSLSGIEATDCGTGYTVCKKIHAESKL